MMRAYAMTALVVLGLVGGGVSHAQPFPGMREVAVWTLINTQADSLGNYDTVSLINMPYAGNKGVWSNGAYYYGSTPGCLLETPGIQWDYRRLAFSIEFMPKELNQPILVAGKLWRWISIEVYYDGKIQAVFNGNQTIRSNTIVDTTQWYRATVAYYDDTARLWVNNQLAGTLFLDSLAHNQDNTITNNHFGTGSAFKGYLRRLRVYTSSTATGTLSPDISSNVRAFPNPAKDVLHVELPDAHPYLLTLTTPDGKVLKRVHPAGQRSIFLSLLPYPSGVYLLTITSAHRPPQTVVVRKR